MSSFSTWFPKTLANVFVLGSGGLKAVSQQAFNSNFKVLWKDSEMDVHMDFFTGHLFWSLLLWIFGLHILLGLKLGPVLLYASGSELSSCRATPHHTRKGSLWPVAVRPPCGYSSNNPLPSLSEEDLFLLRWHWRALSVCDCKNLWIGSEISGKYSLCRTFIIFLL